MHSSGYLFLSLEGPHGDALYEASLQNDEKDNKGKDAYQNSRCYKGVVREIFRLVEHKAQRNGSQGVIVDEQKRHYEVVPRPHGLENNE